METRSVLLILGTLLICANTPIAAKDDVCGLSDGEPVLELVSWTRICDLGIDKLTGDRGQYEASGIQYDGEFLYTVFDNSLRILKVRPPDCKKVPPEWTESSLSTVGWDTKSEYEAITWDKKTEHLYVMVEMEKDRADKNARVIPYEMNLTAGSNEWTDFSFETNNKGFEGSAWLYHCSSADIDGDDYILGLCEGNGCNNKNDTSEPGNGRVVVMGRKFSADGTTTWKEIDNGKLHLPDTACFDDYSDIALYPRFPEACDCNPGVCEGCENLCPKGNGTYAVAVVSQESSALWLGTSTPRIGASTKGRSTCFP